MGFTDAIRTGFQKSFDWKGRASRPAFWYFALFIFLVYIAVVVLAVILASLKIGWLAILLYLFVLVALIFPYLSVAARRLHDQDKTAVWLLLWFVPFGGIVLIVFFCLEGTQGPNQYGSAPDAE
jgi:uncharacterized membrane protein YhaH (DUF805 family)